MKRFHQCMKLIIGIAIVLGSYFSGVYYSKYNQNRQENKSTITTIAVVNTDAGTEVNGEDRYYASELMHFPDTNFEMAGLNEAREGITTNRYAAYIIIPSDFSVAVESGNWKPEKAEITYELNVDLREDARVKVIGDIYNLITELSTNVSYLYVDAILKEVHSVQNGSGEILQNDTRDMEAVNGIDVQKLIDEPEYELLQVVETEIPSLDLEEDYIQLDTAVNMVYGIYQEDMKNAENEFTKIKEHSTGVSSQMEATTQVFTEIDISKDADGNTVYEEGMQNLSGVTQELKTAIEEKKQGAKERLGFKQGEQDPAPEPEPEEGEVRIYLSKEDLLGKVDEQISTLEEMKEENSSELPEEPEGESGSELPEESEAESNNEFPEELQGVLDALYTLKDDINKYYEDGIRAINDIPDGEELLPEAQRILSEEVEAPVLQEVMAEQGRVQEILGNMTGVLQDYLIEVQGYDALSYLEQEKIAEQMSSIYRTVQDMQTEIVDHDSEYRAYIVDVTTTTDENIDMLKESLDQSYDQTKSNVNHTVELLKDNRTTLNEQNVAVLEDITKKLPYTRLGNLEYLQVYDLISQPVVEDDQALENIQIRKTTVTLEWQDMVVGWIGIAALIVIDAAVQFIYKKRMRDLHSGKEGEIWQVE